MFVSYTARKIPRAITCNILFCISADVYVLDIHARIDGSVQAAGSSRFHSRRGREVCVPGALDIVLLRSIVRSCCLLFSFSAVYWADSDSAISADVC